MERRKRKRKWVNAKEDNLWRSYFTKIREVCPWSYGYMDKILVWENTSETCMGTVSKLFRATNFESFVFVYKDKSPEWLESRAELLNKEQNVCEWLWSHPDADSGQNTSTPVPCLIQQDRQRLTNLREKIGYVDED